MRRPALLATIAWTLMLGSAQASVVSWSVETGEYPIPSVGAIFDGPVHGATLEVRASPRAPVEVVRDTFCAGRHQRRTIVLGAFPRRIRMALPAQDPRACGLAAHAAYRNPGQHGRIALRLRY
jgi:hypothetical protein